MPASTTAAGTGSTGIPVRRGCSAPRWRRSSSREAEGLALADLLDLQRHWADTESYRGPHLTVATQGSAGAVPVVMRLEDALGRRCGGDLSELGGAREIPNADLLNFRDGFDAAGQFAVVTRLEDLSDSWPFAAVLEVVSDGSFDLGVVVTDEAGELHQIAFVDVEVAAGERLDLTIRRVPTLEVTLEKAGLPIATSWETSISDGPPEVLGIVQQADPSMDRFGRIVGVLFDEEVDEETAHAPDSYAVGAVTIPMIPPPDLLDGNGVRGAQLQFGNRILYLGLRDPVGPFVRRTLDIRNVSDLGGQIMAPALSQPIPPDPESSPGGQVTGRVLRADGTPVDAAEITYVNSTGDILCEEVAVTRKSTDAEGAYGLDFVPLSTCSRGVFKVEAVDPSSGEKGASISRILRDGQRATVDIVLVGRGSIQGTVRDADGVEVAAAFIKVESETDGSAHTAASDQTGFYRIDRIPVGAISVHASGQPGQAWLSSSISASGEVRTLDVTLIDSPASALEGEVLRPDGISAEFITVCRQTDR